MTAMVSGHRPHFVSLGMFIIDEFSYLDDDGNLTGRTLPPQIGGGGTYAAIGARIWLPPAKVGMIIDRGHDFPRDIQTKLESYGTDMWLFRDNPERGTTRAENLYKGDHRGFKYITPRIRLTPRDLRDTKLDRPATLHFICSPSRASAIVSEINEIPEWSPTTIYEPIPDRCVPEELPALIKVLPSITILSPNAEEALSLLSMPLSLTKSSIEEACRTFLAHGVGEGGTGYVIIRSGALGAYVASRAQAGRWIDAYWSGNAEKVVDVTGAGNSFLGGLSAGLLLAKGDVCQAVLYAAVSASFVIEQEGLPHLTHHESGEQWNGDIPQHRLRQLQRRSEVEADSST